ncbi:SDR family NAD(P)-dependent oxidoreductase [Chelatococcus sp. SYSU_G07232]|uniref:SDR family NAD(P)-dependent oxidoreductase n=1 Tax=Chelatococcus albus TaxID=3047466 RepID=A0ABT7ADP8_9HYPH|nr:SDR family NAD(P)-dependent oxidoreductase [Chelatococcus sp. SYSU_G07232]MDJ1157505.1 SDR family NAD(P)-dependent oxidoreductase [Chelatococcus sp. SYSU_G07232]
MSLSGRHALVTGGGRGIGAAIAAALTAAGAEVSILGRTEETLRNAVALGFAVRYEVADVTDAAMLAESVAALADIGGPVDILVNNAGGAETAPFDRSDAALFARMLALNLTSAVETTRLVLPAMRERGFGRIVNIASTAGLKGYAYCTAYAAAKHALVGFTRALAVEAAKTGVTVNALCPGFTDTDLVRTSVAKVAARTGRGEAEVVANYVAGNPQGRLVRPEEVAAAALWLCGDNAAAVTGQAIAVDGGET